jgi:cytochrome P450
LLTKYPDVEARIQAEMKTMFTSLGLAHDTYLTTDHVQHLVYLEATIRETLRLYPTVPIMQKEAAKDTVICGDIPVRKGEQWCLPIYALARNPDVWGPDASEFKPERWIDPKTGTLLTVPATKFPAFSAGPRVCIGMKLGLLELRVVAANLAHRYRFSLAEPNDGDYIVAISLALKKPLSVHVERTSADAS